jgi:PIN domain nuclease of toxin-antitoxin system
MRALLDTHAFLWFLEGSDQLSSTAREIIEDGGNVVFVSVASLWEIAVKHSLGRLELGKPFEELIPEQLATNAIAVLQIEVSHLTQVTSLPFHHRDPFDRLIAAQALVEDLPVIGVDPAFDSYGVERIW